MGSWGYTPMNGPATWSEFVPAAKGTHQSPIDIEPSKATYDEKLKDNVFNFDYSCCQAQDVINNGASCQVSFKCVGKCLSGGPLSKKFTLAQFHLHWGKDNSRGSEHTVDGHMYPSELHLVHYNSDVYDSIADAVDKPDGLCVLGIFLKIGEEHKGLKGLTSKLKNIHHKGQTTSMAGFDPTGLLPEDTTNYWTYPGSLTTPPCLESVTWVVFRKPIEVSEEQMAEFRSLLCYGENENVPEKENIVDNYRPPLPLNDRKVRASFDQ